MVWGNFLWKDFIDFGGSKILVRMVWGRRASLRVPVHPVSHVTLLVSGGKFAGGLDFSGGRFILFRGALIFFQGGIFWQLKMHV